MPVVTRRKENSLFKVSNKKTKKIEKTFFFLQKIDIDGFWLLPMDLNREQRMVQVVGDRLIWESNSSFGLTFLSQMESKLIIGPGRRLSFRLGDKLYSGRIVNVNCILWNGDEFWHRLVVYCFFVLFFFFFLLKFM
jgi:hypothetical protein